MILLRQGYGGQARPTQSHPGFDPGSMNTRVRGLNAVRRCSWIPTFVGMTLMLCGAPAAASSSVARTPPLT